LRTTARAFRTWIFGVLKFGVLNAACSARAASRGLSSGLSPRPRLGLRGVREGLPRAQRYSMVVLASLWFEAWLCVCVCWW
jgi:hypothetical protein